ncbi:permease [Rhizobium sp. BG4]|jgi:undecaprenyl phosphate-alpha-L-ara4N flippase subunit ArnE|uniref:permease n=1 Tax=Rhizobium sp. BG4 TaxID=2613770 RepID=UPI00193DEDC4|nr:permease [Rhizobium sp. BG4]QRM47685.1 permease [Rhizobium sp. BG4]
MIGGLSEWTTGVIVFCILAETGREICFKRGATGALFADLRNKVIWLGILLWAVELVMWTRVLEEVALSVAFPLMALSYAAIALAGGIIFKETINRRHVLGIALVTFGVVCVGATGL